MKRLGRSIRKTVLRFALQECIGPSLKNRADSVTNLLLFESPRYVSKLFVCIRGNYDLFRISVDDEIGIVRSDDDLTVLLDLLKQRHQLANNKVVVEIVFWLIKNEGTAERIGRQFY